MRDPDLMQRADRAAIALEQAWERWRAMHGLGEEPLPPVSSYVGYSLEEPWGQPRVVFGLRADEAELLASLLDGHDCVGSVYSELGARRDWRLPVSGPVSIPARGYGGPLSVPAQAPPPRADLLPPDPADGFPIGRLAAEDATRADEHDDEGPRSRTTRGSAGTGPASRRAARAPRPDRGGRGTVGAVTDAVEAAPEPEEADWSPTHVEPSDTNLDTDAEAEETAGSQSPPLEPLPDMSDPRQLSDEAGPGDTDLSASVAAREAGVPTGKVRGPGYRGPRYQGFPPRYEDEPSAGATPGRPAIVAADDDDDVGDVDTESAPVRRAHVARLSRSARRRTQSG